MNQELRLPKRTDLDKLNELIDFYETQKPGAGRCIQVWKTPKQLHDMLGVTPDKDQDGRDVYPKELPYRGRMILAIGNQR